MDIPSAADSTVQKQMSVVPRGDQDNVERPGAGAPAHRGRCRSFSFLERGDERWTVFLVTHLDGNGQWRGRFTFRTAQGRWADAEIGTADLFVEESEAEIDVRARGLGRPLVRALLDSALHIHERQRGAPPNVRRWFRSVLAHHSAELAPDIGEPAEELSLTHLKSLYESYRIDQVVHLIALMESDEFSRLVDRILDGRPIDFRARDRLQLAMLVVQDLEQYLRLPPFEVWLEDYLSNRETYAEYALSLHRGGEV